MGIEVHELIIKAVVAPDAKSKGESGSGSGQLSSMQEQNLIQKSLDQVKTYLNSKNER
jgi:Family of unknown function (DUF5908)